MSKRRIFKIGIFLFVYAAYANQAYGSCHSIPPESANPPISYCETWGKVSLRIGDDERSYSSEAFRVAWYDLAAQWLVDEGLEIERLDHARVNFWLSVPEVNPLAAQARVEIIPQNGPRFMLSGHPFPESWKNSPQRSNVAILHSGSYPEDFGTSVGQLLVKSQVEAETTSVEEFLNHYSESVAQPSGGSWYEVSTQPFAEQPILNAMQTDPDYNLYIDTIYYNSLYEWIAWREKAFAFSW